MARAKVYAICMRSRPGRLDGVLMLLDDKEEAEAIAFELRRKGHDVDVREYLASDDDPD